MHLKNKFIVASAPLNPIIFKSHKIKKIPWLWRTLSSVMISHEYGFVYLRIPKAANTFMIYYLFEAFNGECKHFPDRISITKDYFSGAGGMSIFKGSHTLKNYYFFSISRNPYSRTLSCFLEKFDKPSYKKNTPSWGLSDKLTPKDYVNFLNYLLKGGLYKDAHWIPQAHFLWPSKERINYIGRVEKLEKDIRAISDKLGILQSDGVCLEQKTGRLPANRSGKYGDDIKRWERFYGDHYYGLKAKSLVEKIYWEDFKVFRYDVIDRKQE